MSVNSIKTYNMKNLVNEKLINFKKIIRVANITV